MAQTKHQRGMHGSAKPTRNAALTKTDFSDVDLSKTNQKLIELYKTFAAAPERIADLAHYIESLLKTFERLRISLQQTNRQFEGYDGFERTIRDCEVFIQRSKPQENGRGWLYMEDDFTKLQAQITMQISLMSTSTIVLLAYVFISNNNQPYEGLSLIRLLDRETFFSNDDGDPGSSTQISQSALSAQHKSIQDPEFEQLWEKIKRVVYRRKRKLICEPKNNNERVMEVEGLEREVQSEVRQLMLNHQPLMPEPMSNKRSQILDNPQSQQTLDLAALSDTKLLERTQQQERFLLSASGQRPHPRPSQPERMNSFSRSPPTRVWTLPSGNDRHTISENPYPPILGNCDMYGTSFVENFEKRS